MLALPIDSIWYDEIEYVAFQCPYVGGDAVFLARSLYHVINDTIFFNDSLLCEEPPIERVSQNGLVSSNIRYFSVHPNPSDGTFTINYDGSGYENVWFELVDITNRILLKRKLSSLNNREEIDAGNIMNGVYGYRLIADNKVMNTGSLIVI